MKILILKVSAIGDVIHTLPAIFYLKKCCPDVQLSWVVQKKAADLILNQPFLDKVFVLPDKFLHPKNWLKTFKVIRELRQTKWDAIIDFQGIHKTSLLISLLKGRKFGFDAKLASCKFSTYFTHEQVSQEPDKPVLRYDLLRSKLLRKSLRTSGDKRNGIELSARGECARSACIDVSAIALQERRLEPSPNGRRAELANIIQKNLALADYVARALRKSSGDNAHGIYTNQCPSITELKKSFVFKFDQAGMDVVDEWLEKNVSMRAPSRRQRLWRAGYDPLPARPECARSACIEGSPIGRRAEPAKYILLCPNTSWQTKHWPEEYWLELIKILSQENLQHKILLVGQNFGQAAKNIAQSCIGQQLPVYIVPAWDLNTTAYLISKADLLIAPDTGLLHLADFLDTTTIGIFGPTGKDVQGPFLNDINIRNAIQVDDKGAIQVGDNTATQVNDSAVNDSSNNPNFKKATVCQSNMYKLKPETLANKVLQILKNQN